MVLSVKVGVTTTVDCSAVEKTGVFIIKARAEEVSIVSVGADSRLWPKEVGIKKLVKRTPSTKIIENVYRILENSH